MIVKRLQLSEAFGKIMKDVESMEANMEKVALPQDNPQQLFHSQQDLENHIERLKVSGFSDFNSPNKRKEVGEITQPSN